MKQTASRLADAIPRFSLARGIVAVALLALLAAAAPANAASQQPPRCPQDANCIPNPSLEEDGDSGTPAHWSTNKFGESDARFSLVPGHNGGRALSVTVTSAAAPQDAKWFFDNVPVIGGQYLVFSDWYKSEVPTQVLAYFSGGRVPDMQIATVPPASDWTQFTAPGFFVPAGATSVTIAHILSGKGTLTTDEYSLRLQTPPVFEHGLVSLAFDDAWRSIYENAIPVLEKDGLKTTQYVITVPVIVAPEKYADSMSIENVLKLQEDGHEIGAHTRTHADLTQLKSPAQVDSEINGSRADLLGAGVSDVATIAYPYGKYDAAIEQAVKANYIGARSVDLGFNTTDVDRYALKTQLVQRTTSVDQIKTWIDYALANRLWLILTFHRVEKTLDDCKFKNGEVDQSCTDVATVTAVADYLKDMPEGTVATVADVLRDDELWVASVPSDGPAGTTPAGLYDPPSTYAGKQASLEYAMNVLYAAGFHTEEQLLGGLGIAIGESDLWTAARNWQPQWGWRAQTDVIGVRGPNATWSKDKRQMHSDRGMFQISSYWWPKISDEEADDPPLAAADIFNLSKGGTDFSIWDSFRSGRAQSHFDKPFSGWPALRPIVRHFLDRAAADQVAAAPAVGTETAVADAAPDGEAAPAADDGQPAEAAGAVASVPAQDETTTNDDGPWAQLAEADSILAGGDSADALARAKQLLDKAAAAGMSGPAAGIYGTYYRKTGDFVAARQSLDVAARSGNAQAAFELAGLYLSGEGGGKDAARAVALYQQAADAGLKAPAFAALGAYYRDQGDKIAAFTAFAKAAEAGSPEGQLAAGQMLIAGIGTPVDAARGISFLESAAQTELKGPALESLGLYYRSAGVVDKALADLDSASVAGQPQAQLALAEMLMKGEGTDADPARAVALYQQAAVGGLTGPASLALGLYFRDHGEPAKAVEFFDKAANAGEAEAKLALGSMLLKGEGVSVDAARAETLLTEAASQGFAGPALTTLGLYYRSEGDAQKAADALSKAADAGSADAMLELADMLVKGDGISADPERAVTLLKHAADAGLKGPAYQALASYYQLSGNLDAAEAALQSAADAGVPQAKLLLGEALLKSSDEATRQHGIALVQESADDGYALDAYKALGDYFLAAGDNTRAAAALQQAVGQGDNDARLKLAKLLLAGEGVAADPEGAVALLQQAADGGQPAQAYAMLGTYYRGAGDAKKAAAYLGKAAEAGDVDAKLAFGQMLLKGDGVAADPARARQLIHEATAGTRNPEALGTLVQLAVGNYRSASDLEEARSYLKETGALDAGVALRIFGDLQENQKTALVQSILRDKGIYAGPANGLLTTGTMKAIQLFCADNRISQCKEAALPDDLLKTLIAVL
jgi:TPR repeat protein/peptidoglycan/xylan/chitin deacetylase (PgdA/CDA1 family)